MSDVVGTYPQSLPCAPTGGFSEVQHRWLTQRAAEAAAVERPVSEVPRLRTPLRGKCAPGNAVPALAELEHRRARKASRMALSFIGYVSPLGVRPSTPHAAPNRKPISLISHSDVRYRGILAGIDPAASTIQLSNGALLAGACRPQFDVAL